MTTPIFALWFAGLLAITFAAGCTLGLTARTTTRKGHHAHARKR